MDGADTVIQFGDAAMTIGRVIVTLALLASINGLCPRKPGAPCATERGSL